MVVWGVQDRYLSGCDGRTSFQHPQLEVSSRGGVHLPKSISGQQASDSEMACEF